MNLGRFLRVFTCRRVDFKERQDGNPGTVVPLPEANLITSEKPNGDGTLHYPVIDLDHPAVLLESTNGYSHLLIGKELSTEHYDKLLRVLVEVGLLQVGNLRLWESRKYTGVRTPWEIKEFGDSAR